MTVVTSIDKTPPTLRITDINDNDITNDGEGKEELTITYEDDLSGIESVVWQYNPAEKNFDGKEKHPLTNGEKLTDYGWYKITATDKAGNETIWYIYNGPLDITPPTIHITDINGDDVGNDGEATEEMTVTVTDDIAGVDTVVWQYNPDEKNFDGKEEHHLTDGDKLTDYGWYKITATDKVGNQTIWYIYNGWAVCRIEQIYYRRLEWAIDEVPTTNEKTTIVMLRNVSEVNTIPNNKNVLLDIDSKTITGSFTVDSGASLEVEDGTVNNTGTVPLFTNNGKLIVSSGNYESTNSKVIETGGNLEVKTGATLKNTGTGNLVYITGGTTNLENANYIGNDNDDYVVNEGGTLNVNGVNITTNSSRAIRTSSTTNISSGTISTTNTETIKVEGGKTTITGGLIKSKDIGSAIYMTNGTVDVKGGTLENTAGATGAWLDGGVMNVSGGTIKNTGNYVAMRIDGGIANLTGGNYETNDHFFDVSTNGTLNYDGVNLTTDKHIINTSGTFNVISGSMIETGQNAIYVNGGTMNVSGGELRMTDTGYSDFISLQEQSTLNATGGIIQSNSVVLAPGNVGWATISASGNINVSNSALIQKFGTGRAIIEFNGNVNIDGGTVKTTDTTPAGASVEIRVGKLNITGGIIEGTGTTTILTATDVDISGGTIENKSSENTLQIANGTINITGGNILNKASGHVMYVEGGTVNLKGGNFEGNDAKDMIILQNGTINYDGANITDNTETKILEMNNGTFNMISGTMTQTGTHENSRCVTQLGGTFNMTGGTIIGKTKSGNNCCFCGRKYLFNRWNYRTKSNT